MVSYNYDAWGRATITYHSGTSASPAAQNRLLYRGYYYEADIGLYYLQSRYYDPNTGRFINADGLISTGTGLLGYNMYAYCNNNPVMWVDSFGAIPFEDHWYAEDLRNFAESIGQSILNFFYGPTKNSPADIHPEYNSSKRIKEGIEVIDASAESCKLSGDTADLRRFTDEWADLLENQHSDFFTSKIDRVQLYSELKFHVIMYDRGVFTENAKISEITFYSDGRVVDDRWWLNMLVRILYGGEY